MASLGQILAGHIGTIAPFASYAEDVKVLMSARPTDFEMGYLAPLPALLATGGLTIPLRVIQISITEEESVRPSSRGVEVINLEVLQGKCSSVSSDSIQVYSRLVKSGALSQAFAVGTQMLNRHDLSGTFRFVDREALLRLAALQITDLLHREKPSLVVFMNTPHLFGDLLLFEISSALNLKTLFFQSVPVAPVMLPKTRLGTTESRKVATKVDGLVGDEITHWTRKRIRGLIEKEPPPYISRQRFLSGRALSRSARLRNIASYIRWLKVPRFPESRDFTGSAMSAGMLRNSLSVFLNAMLQRGLRQTIRRLSSDPPQGTFALFALHYEPEKTTTPEGYPIEQQLDAVVRVRSLLPNDVHLAVKEHYSQSSPALRGYLGRSSFFYDSICLLPNTSLIGPDADTQEFLPRAKYVFTLTGTVALEAVAKGVPVGYFGAPWWAGMPGSARLQENTRVRDLDSLTMPSLDELEQFCLDVVNAEAIPGIASEDREDYMKRNGQLSNDFWKASVRGIAGQILEEIGLGLPTDF